MRPIALALVLSCRSSPDADPPRPTVPDDSTDTCVDVRLDLPGGDPSDPDDCNRNGVPDDADIAGGFSVDCDDSGVPDECEVMRDGCVAFGPNLWYEYRAGTLPIVLSAPHGGSLMPDELDTRPDASTGSDTNTQQTTQAISDALFDATGQRPHVVLLHLHRHKVEANGWTLASATAGQPEADAAYFGYHAFVDAARRAVEAQYGRGFYVDVHGLSSVYTENQLGYLIDDYLLELDDERLAHPGHADISSIRQATLDSGEPFVELLRGLDSVGATLQAHGYPSVPSPAFSSPIDGFFEGGYSTWAHGSRLGGQVSGMQIEHVWEGVRDTSDNREAYAEALVDALTRFLDRFLDLSIAGTTQVGFTQARAEVWESGEPLAIRAARTGDLSTAVEVGLVVGGSAIEGEDYESLPATVSFDPGQTEQTLNLVPLDDAEAEGPETIDIALVRGPLVNVVGATPVQVSLADDEQPGVWLESEVASMVEGEPVELRVIRDDCASDRAIEIVTAGAEVAPVPATLLYGQRTATVSYTAPVTGALEGVRWLSLSIDDLDPPLAMALRDAELDAGLTSWFDGRIRDGALVDAGPAGVTATVLPDGHLVVDDDGAIAFDGDDDMVLVDGLALAPAGELTLAMWFRAGPETAGDFSYLVSQNSVYGSPALNVYLTEGGTLRTVVTGAGEAYDLFALDVTGDFRDDAWHHYALTVTGDESVVYVDGTALADADRAGGAVDMEGVRTVIGGRYDAYPTRHFGGQLRDVRLYDRAVDDSEVAVLAGS